ncbi:MAG: aspartate carbamoyltransferase, partial [bacterium]|nr:aspartate carbamoyltransferase [bacterium]
MKHIIDAREFDKKFIEEIFSIADSLHGKRNKSLDGKIMASIFYEPSTRTRMSFESAMMRLGGDVISMENAAGSSSAAKGETIEDTMQMLNQYVDAAVIRHPETGTLARAASVAKIPLLNAGDGTGQHPTQALLDLYTIRKEIGRTENIRLVGVGDMKNGRTIRSLCYL